MSATTPVTGSPEALIAILVTARLLEQQVRRELERHGVRLQFGNELKIREAVDHE